MISAAMDLDDPALRKEIEATLAKHGYTSEHLAKQSSGKRGSSDRAASRRKRARRAAPKSPLPRELVLAWCLWLLGGLMVTWAMDMPAAEMIRWMVIGSLIGMMLLWPTFRLSQSPGGLENPPDEKTSGQVPNPASDPAQDTLITPMVILRDWFFLILVFQAVIWPLRLTAQWSTLQTVWLDAAVAAWTLLSAVLIAWGCLSNRGRDRTLAMVLCLLLLFGEPIAMWLVNLGASPPGAPHYSWTMRISPFETVWTLTHLTAVNVSRPSQIGWLLWPLSLPVLVVAATALLGWVIVGLAGIRSGRAVRLRLGSTVPESSAAN